MTSENNEMLKNSSNYFREYLLSDEDVARSHAEYVTKLRQQYLSMGLERLFVDEIQEHLEFKHKDIDRTLSRKRLQYILENEDQETILQKYAYLAYLVNNDIVAYSLLHLNYFKHTIFAPLFEGESAAEIGNHFLEIEQVPRAQFFSLVNEQIDKIAKFDEVPAQRLRMRSQKELVQKTVEALERGTPGKIVFDKKGEDFQLKKAIELVAAKIVNDIQKKMEQGINQQHVLMAFKCFRLGTLTEETNEILQNLVIEATVDTELIKLPKVMKERMSLFTHLHKKKVADSIVGHITNRILELGGSQFEKIDETDAARRNAITITPEVLRKFEQMKNLSMEQIVQDQELFNLVQSRIVGINLESQSKELLKNESDAKLHSIIFNPSNQEIPVNIGELTPEELEQNNITAFKASEIQLDNAGNIKNVKTKDQKILQFFSKVEHLYDQKHKKKAEIVQETPSATDYENEDDLSRKY